MEGNHSDDFPCFMCLKVFKTVWNLKDHLRKKHHLHYIGKSTFKCHFEDCQLEYGKFKGLMNHYCNVHKPMILVGKAPFYCLECSGSHLPVFSSKLAFQAHVSRYHNNCGMMMKKKKRKKREREVGKGYFSECFVIGSEEEEAPKVQNLEFHFSTTASNGYCAKICKDLTFYSKTRTIQQRMPLVPAYSLVSSQSSLFWNFEPNHIEILSDAETTGHNSSSSSSSSSSGELPPLVWSTPPFRFLCKKREEGSVEGSSNGIC